jgi:hypothetical protein
MQITRNGLKTATGPSDWFTGAVYIDRWQVHRTLEAELARTRPREGMRAGRCVRARLTVWRPASWSRPLWLPNGRRGGPLLSNPLL